MEAQVISFLCVLKNSLGQVLSSSYNQDVLTSTKDPSAPLPVLAEALCNIQKGERKKIFVPAEKAYGFYDLEKVKSVPLEDFTELPELGEKVRFKGQDFLYRVVEIGDSSVTLDANHPFAGQDLIFEIEGLASRKATHEDLSSEAEAPSFH